jgi:uncharacterized protein YbjT (DUF2867 family)
VEVVAGDLADAKTLADAFDGAGVRRVTVLGGDGSICTAGKVEEAFAHTKSAMVHHADIAAVAASALTSDGHAGKSYWLTGPEALTPKDRLRILSAVINQPGAGARAVAGRR